MSKFRVALSGNIGVGKSTLGEKLGEKEGVKYYKEHIDRELLQLFTDQVILKKYDKDKPIELLHQLRFLNETVIRDIKSEYYDSQIDVFDRAIFEHIHVFAVNTLKPRDWALFNGLQELILSNLKWEKYDLTIILQDDIMGIYNKVGKRSRNEEELTDEYKAYLKQLNEIYNSARFLELAEQYSEKVVVLDVNGLNEDEVNRQVDIIIRENQYCN